MPTNAGIVSNICWNRFQTEFPTNVGIVSKHLFHKKGILSKHRFQHLLESFPTCVGNKTFKQLKHDEKLIPKGFEFAVWKRFQTAFPNLLEPFFENDSKKTIQTVFGIVSKTC